MAVTKSGRGCHLGARETRRHWSVSAADNYKDGSARPDLSCSLTVNLWRVQTGLSKMACINLHWKHLLRNKLQLKKNEDYIYLQWHFMTSNNKGSPASHSSDELHDIRSRSVEEEVSVPEPESSIFSDIHTWLANQPDHFCAEIYCDCCDPTLDLHYSCVNISFTSQPSLSIDRVPLESTSQTENSRNLNRRQDSISSVATSASASSCVTHSSGVTLGDDECEESNYSLQIRRKSISIFRSKRMMI